MEISTLVFKELASKVAIGVVDVKMLPVTSYLKIRADDSKISLTATDGVNFLTVFGAVSSKEKFGPVIVKAESLLKLPAKTTKEMMKLVEKEDHLLVTGNGTYKVPILGVSEFPEITFESEQELSASASPELLKRMFLINKSSIAVDMSYPFLTGYYIKDAIITTDRNRMCINKSEGLLSGNTILLSQRFVDIVNTFKNNMTVQISKEGNLRFASADMVLVGPQLSGVNEYPNLDRLFEIKPKGKIVFNRAQMLSILDRVMLFVDAVDNYGIYITYSKEESELMNITDLKHNSIESIEFTGSKEEDFRICLNTKYLVDMLAILSSDTVEFQYEQGSPLKVDEGNVTLLLCILEPEVIS